MTAATEVALSRGIFTVSALSLNRQEIDESWEDRYHLVRGSKLSHSTLENQQNRSSSSALAIAMHYNAPKWSSV
jgi:hypothetical protein